MAKRKRKKRTPLKKLELKADKALSNYIRALTIYAYDLCPLCNKNPVEVSFHFLSRRRKATRWVDHNVVGACRTCNYIEQYLPDWSRAWYIRTNGVDRYLTLVEEAKQDFIPTIEYLEGVVKTYTDLLTQLEVVTKASL